MEPYKTFREQRCKIVKEIKTFLTMLLHYFSEMEQIRDITIKKRRQQSSLKKLIESLCFLHGLYGFPAEGLQDEMTALEFNAKIEKILYNNDYTLEELKEAKKLIRHANKMTALPSESIDKIKKILYNDDYTPEELQEAKKLIRQTEINQNAVKNIFEKINAECLEKNEKTFVDYCGSEITKDEFWTFNYGDKLESLPREPAYCFLQLVRDMFDDGERDKEGDEEGDNIRKIPATVGRKFLNQLPGKNKLKPNTWAHQERTQNFGVSLGVQSFVRPLYLWIKLKQLSHPDVGKKCELKDAKASKIQHEDVVKDPCVSCQKMFGSPILFPLGNCAEYDVIGKVDLIDLPESHWQYFNSACERHFNAFKKMDIQLREEQRNNTSEEIVRKYCDRRSRTKLKYKLEIDLDD